MFTTVILLLKYESIGAEEKLRNWLCDLNSCYLSLVLLLLGCWFCHGSINSWNRTQLKSKMPKVRGLHMYQISCIPLIILISSLLALENAWASPEAHLLAGLLQSFLSCWLHWQLALRRGQAACMKTRR